MGLAAAIVSPKRTRTQDAGLKARRYSKAARIIYGITGVLYRAVIPLWTGTARSGKKKTEVWHLKGKVIIHDPDWWKAMTEEEVDDLLEGRF
jgi:hypothetical protein